MKKISALALGLVFVWSCAASKSDVAYKEPPERPLLLKKINLTVTDQRKNKEIISPAVKNMKTWAGVGGVVNRIEDTIRKEPDKTQDINLPQAFENAVRQRFSNLGVNAVPGQSAEEPTLYIEIERFWLDLEGSTFKAEVTYLAKLTQGGRTIHHDRITGRVEKYNLMGDKTGWNILSEAFSSAVNSLNVDFLTEKP